MRGSKGEKGNRNPFSPKGKPAQESMRFKTALFSQSFAKTPRQAPALPWRLLLALHKKLLVLKCFAVLPERFLLTAVPEDAGILYVFQGRWCCCGEKDSVKTVWLPVLTCPCSLLLSVNTERRSPFRHTHSTTSPPKQFLTAYYRGTDCHDQFENWSRNDIVNGICTVSPKLQANPQHLTARAIDHRPYTFERKIVQNPRA